MEGLTFPETVKASGTGDTLGTFDVVFEGVELNVTRDLSGNYVVTKTVNGLLTIVISDNLIILSKELSDFNGDLASYRIIVNPEKEILNGGSPLTLQDTFSKEQSINYGSITVTGERSEDVTYDYSGNTGTYSIPDGSSVTIEYVTRVKGDAGEEVEFSNTAVLGRMKDGAFVGGHTASTANKEIITPTGTDISGTGGVYTIDLFAYAQDHMEKGLGGAVFRLLDNNMKPMYYKAGPNKGKPITFTTDDGTNGGRPGYVTIGLNEETDGLSIHKNTAYYLEMITAPYEEDPDAENGFAYYQKDNTFYSFLITDDPDYTYGGIYSYFNGDVLKVRCYRETKGVNITARFSGSYSLTDEQKKAIIFVLQKQDLSVEGGWVDVESHTYGEFTYGSMNFNIGRTGGTELEDNITYRVIEKNVLPPELEGVVEEAVSVSVTYQLDGHPVEEDSNEFFVDALDKLAYSYNLAFTNEYIDHKLGIIKIDENSGRVLPGAVFTVYAAADDREVVSHTTDTEGKLNIRRTDEGANYQPNTLYYVKETGAPSRQTGAPADYILPVVPEQIYFYFEENGAGVPAGLPEGATVVELTHSYSTLTVGNSSDMVDVPVTVVWGISGSDSWPDNVSSVVVHVNKTVDGVTESVMVQAVDDTGKLLTNELGEPIMEPTITLTKERYYRTGIRLPALEDGKPVRYSIEEEHVYDTNGADIKNSFACSSSVSGTGWYVVHNQPAVSVTVKKEWYELDGTTQVDDTSALDPVTFDLYRTTTMSSETEFTHARLEALLFGATPVREGLELNAANGWTVTVESLEKTNKAGTPYHYYAIEHVPDNQEDSYVVSEAEGQDTLTIKNTQTPITVTINVNALEKTYGDPDPAYEVTATIMDSATISVSGPDAGVYTATVKKTDETDETGEAGEADKTIRFTIGRVGGEDVGTYAVTASLVTDGDEQEFRVLFNTASLTINRAEVTITAGAEKTYGENDPTLVDFDGLKKNEDPDVVLRYSVYRDEGEDVGDYDIELYGEEIQGNYKVAYVPGKFTIKRKTVTVTAENKTKTYGEEDPDFTWKSSGVIQGDDPNGFFIDLTRTEGEDAGEYVIKPSGDEEQGNYELVFVNGVLKINPAPLTIKIEDDEKTYGEADVEWEVTFDGLITGEDNGELSSVLNETTGIRSYTYSLQRGEKTLPLITFDTSRVPGETIGEYAVTISNVKQWDTRLPTEGQQGEGQQGEGQQGEGQQGEGQQGEGQQGEGQQGEGQQEKNNYVVTLANGKLEIQRAELTVKPQAQVKAKITAGTEEEGVPDPLLMADIEGWKNGDENAVGTSEVTANEGDTPTITWTYKLGSGENAPVILTFTLKREKGEDEGEYIVDAEGNENQSNYRVSFETGTFSILSVLDIDVTQPLTDYADADAKPSYTYTVTLDLTGTGLSEYNENGFEHKTEAAQGGESGSGETGSESVPTLTFTLPDPTDGSNIKTLKVPAGARLTITQTGENPDYSLSITQDDKPYTNPSSAAAYVLEHANTYHRVAFRHTRISLPVEARAAENKETEAGATVLTGRTGAMGIPRDAEGNLIERAIDSAFADDMHSRIGYTLPQNMYYVYDHASLYPTTGDMEPVTNITRVRYVEVTEEGGAEPPAVTWQWQYKVGEDGEFTKVPDNTKLVLFYLPKYVCKIGETPYFTLKDAVKAVPDGGSATIEMLIPDYAMRASADKVTIPNGREITITTAAVRPEGEVSGYYYEGEADTAAAISRSRSYTDGTLFVNEGTLILENISIDGKGVGASAEMICNNKGTAVLTVGDKATLQNANGGETGGAIRVVSGTVTVAAGGALTGNYAANGGAIYAGAGTVNIENGSHMNGNSAENGGAVYVTGGTVNFNASDVTGNSATNGGAVYMLGDVNVNVIGTVGCEGDAGSEDANNATNGGAVFIARGTLKVTGTLQNNAATNGGAIYQEGGTVNVIGASVKGNTAAQNGGMLYASNGAVNIKNAVDEAGTTTAAATIQGNAATGGNGGAICYAGSGTVTLESGNLKDNTALNGYGGALYLSSGTVDCKGGNIGANGAANKAKNGSGFYIAGTGIGLLSGGSIQYNDASAGGAVGVESAARLHFSGNIVIKDNKLNGSGKSNLYLNVDSDEIINTAGLGGSASIGVYVADKAANTTEGEGGSEGGEGTTSTAPLLDKRGDACGLFGTYTGDTNLSKFTNDRYSGLSARSNNFKIMWGAALKVEVRRLDNGTYPPATGNSLKGEFTYYPKSRDNAVYDLVMEIYPQYKDTLKNYGDYLYAYTYDARTTAFSSFLTDVNWDSVAQKWRLVKLGDGEDDDNTGTKIVIYYTKGTYLSICNNSEYTIFIDPLTVMGKTALGDHYGYATAKNYVTLPTLLPVTEEDLTLKPGDASALKPGDAIKLLFPSAVGKRWELNGVLLDADGVPVSGGSVECKLNNTGSSPTTKTVTSKTDGTFTQDLSGTTNSTAGGTYEILFGSPTYICKVGEHPFSTLNDAWDYIVNEGLSVEFDFTYVTTENGKEVTRTETRNAPGGTIEMLLDYLQPKKDVLNIPAGHYLKLTTAAPAGTEGVDYTYVGTDSERATISRDVDNDGAGVVSEAYKSSLKKAYDCDTYLTVENIIFDGKALAKKGNGGAINTVNNVLTITNCDFKGYQAQRGGAVFSTWGGITVTGCNFSNCVTGDTADKTGGGAIWSTAEVLTVTDCNFDHCACESGKSQAGAIFHNINQNNALIYTGASGYANFGSGNYYLGTKTVIDSCTFEDCYAIGGSGGTIESDSLRTYITNCSFNGSYSNKDKANGGAINILHNSLYVDNGNYTPLKGSVFQIVNCSFKNCQTQKTGTRGGAIQASNTETIQIWGCSFEDVYSEYGGAVRSGAVGGTMEILGCTFKNCTGKKEGGAVYSPSQTLTIGDTYTVTAADGTKTTVTKPSSFTNCTSPKGGGVYQNRNAANSSVEVTNTSFTNCTTTNDHGGALHILAQNLTVTGTKAAPSTFTNCSASKAGGGIYHAATSDTLNNVSFEGCTSGTNGGAAYFGSTTVSLTNTAVSNCTATSNGGGIYTNPGKNGNGVSYTDCSFSGNVVTSGTGNGGAIFNEQKTITVTGGVISDSSAAYGGGIYTKGELILLQKGTGDNAVDAQITGCKAGVSGGGVYGTSTITLKGVEISECYARTSGGGIYHTGTIYFHNASVSKCVAQMGGGLYSTGLVEINSKAEEEGEERVVTISDCQAKDVSYKDDGSVEIAGQFNANNKGGGIYKASSNNLNLTIPNATISGCSAYDGGGLYNAAGGTTTVSNGKFTGNTAENSGGAIYKAGGMFTINGGVIGGSEEDANTAKTGGGLFVASGQTVAVSGGQITYNKATEAGGGGIAVGGANAVLNFSGAPMVRYNTMTTGSMSEPSNVYLNYDTNAIIKSSGLTTKAWIGVRASDDQDEAHGEAAKHFGIRSNTDYLNRFHNDRGTYLYGVAGSNSYIDWADFVCKITDADGNLLYLDTEGSPAVFEKLENRASKEWVDGAFNILRGSDTPNLYKKVVTVTDGTEMVSYEQYTGNEYEVQMLVSEYDLKAAQIKLEEINSNRKVTLTTASPNPDECGFYYMGLNPNAPARIFRSAQQAYSMVNVDKNWEISLRGIILDGGEKTATEEGGILRLMNGKVSIDNGATLQNGFSATGGAAYVSSNAVLSLNKGGRITECKATTNGGAVAVVGSDDANDAPGVFELDGGEINSCTATNGGGVYVEGTGSLYLRSGTITNNSATTNGGGISFGSNTARAYFGSGDANAPGVLKVTGNTMGGNACNVQFATSATQVLANVDDTYTAIINANGLDARSEIGVYVAGSATDANSLYNKYGIQSKPFGVRHLKDENNNYCDDSFYCFVNDRLPQLRGYESSDPTNDIQIYWEYHPLLMITKNVSSDWSGDKQKDFTFTVQIVLETKWNGQDDPVTLPKARNSFGDMDFDRSGMATIKLKAGEAKTAVLPDDLHLHSYVVTEIFPDGADAKRADYTVTASKDGTAWTFATENGEDLLTVTGALGENLTGAKATSLSDVAYTNTRVTGAVMFTKKVTSSLEDDKNESFDFTLTLGGSKDEKINKTYQAITGRLDENGKAVDLTETELSFIDSVANFTLDDGGMLMILDLPTGISYTLKENLSTAQQAKVRPAVKQNLGAEFPYDNKDGVKGTIGESWTTVTETRNGTDTERRLAARVDINNSFLDIVCKITNRARELLYYRDTNGRLQPAIFSHLEDAFDQINSGNLKTATNGSVSGMLRIEMVVPEYAMERPATLNNGKNVMLSTALTSDGEYPYHSDDPNDTGVSTVYRGFASADDESSMFVINGTLNLDKITLDGGRSAYVTQKGERKGPYSASDNGGIIKVAHSVKLTVNSAATLRNSVTTGNGGAIYMPAGATLSMNGTIDNCSAASGGGVYADNNFTTISVNGTLPDENGVSTGGMILNCTAQTDGGAICVGTGRSINLGSYAKLFGNQAGHNGGGISSGANVILNGIVGGVDRGNTAGNEGGGICMNGDAQFTMYAGSEVSGNTAAYGGGVSTRFTTRIASGKLSGNTAKVTQDGEGGLGGALYAAEGATVTISGTSVFDANSAQIGGAIYDRASITMTAGTMTNNIAALKGGAVYVADTPNAGEEHNFFAMQNAKIQENRSPQGAVSSDENSWLIFSGNAVVTDNSAPDAANPGSTIPMNVYLGYNSNNVIRTPNLGSSASIGIYVADGEPEGPDVPDRVDNPIYCGHGLPAREFGTYTGSNVNGAKLEKFFNDRDTELKGMSGAPIPGAEGQYTIMWKGKPLQLMVSKIEEGKPSAPAKDVRFTFTNLGNPENTEDDVLIWEGKSGETGLVQIPWGGEEIPRTGEETKDGGAARFDPGTVYKLQQTAANGDTVLPAGYWKVVVARDNAVTWELVTSAEDTADRTMAIRPPLNSSGKAYLGEVFRQDNDVKPVLTFDVNAWAGSEYSDKASLSGGVKTRDVIIDFDTTEIRHDHTITEKNPTWDSHVFRTWATMEQMPKNQDNSAMSAEQLNAAGYFEYTRTEEITFYRGTEEQANTKGTSKGDLTLYAQWDEVVCKITDASGNLLYLEGGVPAVYGMLETAFEDVSKVGSREIFLYRDPECNIRDRINYHTTLLIEMLVPSYTMKRSVTNDKLGTVVLTTAPTTDTDGYAYTGAENSVCTIYRGDCDTSIISNERNLMLTDIILDGQSKNVVANGGLIYNSSAGAVLTVSDGATLRNARATGNGGAVWLHEGSSFTLSGGTITDCYADKIGEDLGNGGAVYVGENSTFNMHKGIRGDSTITGCSAAGNGGAVCLGENSTFTLDDGKITNNSAVYGGAVNTLQNSLVILNGGTVEQNTASANGGAIYVNDSASVLMIGGSLIANRADGNGESIGRGGAIYLAPNASAGIVGGTINGNTSRANGAGIYVDEGAELRLSDNPDFGGTGLLNGRLVRYYRRQGGLIYTGNFSDNASNALGNNSRNGGKEYWYARQDIYLANDNEKQPASILVSGNLTGHDGTIWVWPEKEYHYKQLMPFAKLANGVSGGNLKVFRNARPDTATENGTSTYLYGTPEGETAGYVYWSGLKGSRTVILRKVVGSEAQAGSLAGKSFAVYRQGESEPYVVKHEIRNAAGAVTASSEERLSADHLISGANGVFWVGELPFGEYNIVESGVSDYYFRLVVGDKDGETELPDGYRITRVSRS